jgi:DDE superfamily endonuclease
VLYNDNFWHEDAQMNMSSPACLIKKKSKTGSSLFLFICYCLLSNRQQRTHRARETIELLQRETPDFITPDLWPPYSPDLNPVDYRIWGILQERVYRKSIKDVDELKLRLIEAWSGIQQSVIDHAICQWRVRLNACVKAKGKHFEHML